jgi:type IV fimbrial biogenesis protein FimT
MTGMPGRRPAATIRNQEGWGMRLSHFETRAPGQRGFTLIELMVTVTVAGVVLAIGIPSFTKLIANNRIATQTNEFVSALNLARSEAVRRAQGVSVRSSDGGVEFAGGWKVYKDPNLAGAAPASDDIIRESSGLAGKTTLKLVTKSGTAPNFVYTNATAGAAIVFNSRGGNNAADVYLRVCTSGDSSIKGRVLQVSAMGKISIYNPSATCP